MSSSVTNAVTAITSSRLVVASSQPVAASSQAVVTTSRAVVASSQAVVASSQPVMATTTSQPAVTPLTSSQRITTSIRRARTSTTLAPSAPASTPYDSSSERRADTQRTNKILIGVFAVLGLVLIAFAGLRYKRRRRSKSVPLPPPREPSISQLGYGQSRAVSMYKEYPTPDFSRPPSMLMRHGSGSGLIATPSVRSNPSIEALKSSELGRKISDRVRTPAPEYSPDNSISGLTVVPTDEEAPHRPSHLGSRSESPSNLLVTRPPSQAQVYPRPDSRGRLPRPNSVSSASRHSYLGPPPSRHGSMARNSIHDPHRRLSYYANGNHGAPHTPHARDRVGLVMPQPLAPELFSYALSGRHDMGLDFSQGGWGGSPANEQDPNQPLAPPRLVRTDSWVGTSHSGTPSDSPVIADAPPLPPAKDRGLPRGHVARPEIPRP